MKRTPSQLADTKFDLLVIGAGIHGACIAREASLRGLRVALIDRDDFGAATSASSLKIIHGGLRYLQKLDIKRMRESVRERRTLLRIAPHLVHPLPCLVPTQGWGQRSRVALSVALKLSGWIAPDSHESTDASHDLPPSRVISRSELLALFPDLQERPEFDGAALWHDAQAYHTERLTLAFVVDAVERDAIAANYVEGIRLLVRHGRVVGAEVEDRLSGEHFDIRADVVVNAAGPWIHRVLGGTPEFAGQAEPMLCKAWNVVTDAIHPTHAIGVLTQRGGLDNRGGRMLFIAPWRGRSILGTMYTPADSSTTIDVTDAEVEELIAAANTAYPASRFAPENVTFRHGGLLFVSRRDARRGVDVLADRPTILDHGQRGGVRGLLSVRSVKYTTGRLVAERVVARAIDLLARRVDPTIDGSHTVLPGGDVANWGVFVDVVQATLSHTPAGAATRLARNYGTRVDELIKAIDESPEEAEALGGSVDAIRAEVRYGVRKEMAVRLADIVLRRTDLGTAAYPGDQPLRACAALMAEELGWTSAQTDEEINEVARVYGKTSRHYCAHAV